MGHFAEILPNNVVVQVLRIPNEQDHRGSDFLSNDLSLAGRWVQTSYNTHGGVHINGGTPLRKNYAGIGYTYDPDRDAFIPPKPFDSWLLNEDTCLWEPPTPYPDDGERYMWDETTVSWVQSAE